jgi:hypothetical protein
VHTKPARPGGPTSAHLVTKDICSLVRAKI